MSEEISEETLKNLLEAVEHISDDSTEMRENMKRIVKILEPYVERAGIRYGGETWTEVDIPNDLTLRIATRKMYDGWTICVERTEAVPEYWDGSNYVGWEDPFGEEAEAYGMVRCLPIEHISRKRLEKVIELFPEFLEGYVEELKRRKVKYADLKNKTKKILEVLSDEI